MSEKNILARVRNKNKTIYLKLLEANYQGMLELVVLKRIIFAPWRGMKSLKIINEELRARTKPEREKWELKYTRININKRRGR